MKKKLLASAVAALGMMAAGSASAIVAGGVDFGVLGETGHLETTTLAETIITGDGQNLLGYGVVDRVNGSSSYAAAGQKLFFVFTDYASTNFTPTTVDFTGGTISVFIGADFNFLDSSSATNIATIQSYALWAELAGHDVGGGITLSGEGTLTGTSITFNGDGLLDVTGGLADVVAYLDNDGIPDGVGGLADIVFSTEGNNTLLNPNDDTTGCMTGQANPDQFCIQGSASLRGVVTQVPEPGVLSLLGLGLVGVGAASLRRRKTA